MKNSPNLHDVVYSVLLTQIRFGAYRCAEKLPTIEETSAQLHVSVATARCAYLKLKEQGYISLSKNVGATVKANYTSQETEQFIQAFFSARRTAMTDLGKSLRPLFGNVQWVGLKSACSETLLAIEALAGAEHVAAPYAMLEHLNQKYSVLGNSLLMRLTRQTFLFLHAPFFSIKENLQYFDQFADYLPQVLALCRSKDWPALRAVMDRSIDKLSLALDRFYASRITPPSPEGEISFAWSSYQKSDQLCYSLAMELLISISRGIYPAGSLLPSQAELASQKGVSVSTVRRALSLLGSVGAIRSAQYVGTRVLPLHKATEHSDFSNPALQRRLLDMAESLHIFALSCREVSLLTLSSPGSDMAGRLCGELKARKQWRRGEVLSYFLLDFLAQNAPYQAIRTVYSELRRQFFWAYALRGMEGSQAQINALYDPYFDALIGALEKEDASRFSAVVEELAVSELLRTVELLSQLGVPGANALLLPNAAGA